MIKELTKAAQSAIADMLPDEVFILVRCWEADNYQRNAGGLVEDVFLSQEEAKAAAQSQIQYNHEAAPWARWGLIEYKELPNQSLMMVPYHEQFGRDDYRYIIAKVSRETLTKRITLDASYTKEVWSFWAKMHRLDSEQPEETPLDTSVV